MLLSRVCDSVVNYFLYSEESRETNERTPAAPARGPGTQRLHNIGRCHHIRDSQTMQKWKKIGRELEFAFEDMYNADRK